MSTAKAPARSFQHGVEIGVGAFLVGRVFSGMTKPEHRPAHLRSGFIDVTKCLRSAIARRGLSTSREADFLRLQTLGERLVGRIDPHAGPSCTPAAVSCRGSRSPTLPPAAERGADQRILVLDVDDADACCLLGIKHVLVTDRRGRDDLGIVDADLARSRVWPTPCRIISFCGKQIAGIFQFAVVDRQNAAERHASGTC